MQVEDGPQKAQKKPYNKKKKPQERQIKMKVTRQSKRKMTPFELAAYVTENLHMAPTFRGVFADSVPLPETPYEFEVGVYITEQTSTGVNFLLWEKFNNICQVVAPFNDKFPPALRNYFKDTLITYPYAKVCQLCRDFF